MRKITSLLMLCLMALGLTANAQTAVSAETLNALTEATDIQVRNISPTNRWYFCGDKNVESNTNAESVLVWEPVGDGNFYLKKKNPTGTQGEGYLQTSAPSAIGAKATAQKFTAVYAYPTDAPDGTADATNLVRFSCVGDNAGKWINCQATTGTPVYNSGAGAWTMHNVYLVASTPEPEPTTKEYRIKDVASGKYMNASNYDNHPTGPIGGVNFVDKAESNDQVFTFEADGTNYKLKTKSGKYIFCQNWNVDALEQGSALTFVDNGDGTYYIKNGNKYFKVEYVSDKPVATIEGLEVTQAKVSGYFPYCDAEVGAAAKFIVEEITVVPDPDPEVIEPIKASDFAAEKVYVIKNVSNSRSGYLYVGGDNALCIGDLADLKNAPDNYLFKAMPTNSGLVLKAVEGGYVPTGDGAGTNLSATTVSKAAVVTVAAKGGTYPETTLNMLVNGNYCNVNPGAFCTWNDKNDANGVWEIYAIEEIANVEAAQMTAVTTLAEQALALDGVGYPVASERENLNNTVAAAKAFNTSGAWYEEMVNTLTAYASTTNINLPEDGKAYTFTNVQKNGTKYYWHYDASGVTMSSNAADATVYVCKDLKNGKYAFVNNEGKFMIFKGTEGSADNGQNNNKGYIDAYDATYADLTIAKLAGPQVSPANPADIFGFVSINGHRKEGNDKNGCHVIKKDGNFDMADGAYFNDNFSSAFQLVGVEYPNKPVVNDAQGVNKDVAALSTFCAPFATVAPSNVDVYIATSDESHYIKLQKVEGAVPANTGVVLVSKEDAQVGKAVTMVPATTETPASVEGNLLRGDAAKADFTVGDDVNAYVLSAVERVVGFYPLSATNRTIAQGKAYLELDASLSAVKLYFGGDEATGIETVVKENANAPIFDLSGRRVVNVAKGGIYIQNGKKFIVK